MADLKTYLGIDVGTGSARAGLFSADGALLGTASVALETNHPQPNFVEQSSSQVWDACCSATRAALAQADIDPASVAGIGFDATCSLVVLDQEDQPLSVSPRGDDRWNIVVWMDHRAIEQASRIDATGHPILQRTGGKISPEMEIPKLAWLKETLPRTWASAGAFYDLPDWLVHQATGSTTRSLCSTVCKWTYFGEDGRNGEGWNAEFLKEIGLGELLDNRYQRIGNAFLLPGEVAGRLRQSTAEELSLVAGTPVAAGAIDAYAGALGTLGIGLELGNSLADRIALVGGTSTCHLVTTKNALFVPGIWGPYYSVLLSGMWTNEAGQSASGALIDRVLKGDAAWPELEQDAKALGSTVYQILNARLAELADGKCAVAELTSDLHVQPDFHGNRSPIADPHRKGAIVGLTLETGRDQLAVLYLATIQSLAYSTKHILETFAQHGARFDTIAMSGGLSRNALYCSEHANVTGCKVFTADQSEAVLLGSAIMGAVSAGAAPDLASAIAAMKCRFQTVQPDASQQAFHDRKYRVFRQMQRDYEVYRDLMQDEEK